MSPSKCGLRRAEDRKILPIYLTRFLDLKFCAIVDKHRLPMSLDYTYPLLATRVGDFHLTCGVWYVLSAMWRIFLPSGTFPGLTLTLTPERTLDYMNTFTKKSVISICFACEGD